MYAVIVNPTAGSGRAAAVCEQVERILSGRGIAHRIYPTDTPGHASELAASCAKSGCAAIVAVGGDGTFSEVAAGLTEHAVPLFFVPCGTGNDFARMLNLPADPAAALTAQLDGTDTFLDMGTVNGKGFLNVAGTGFDVEVLREAARYKHVGKGLVPYLLGLIAALKKFRSFKAELTLDTGEVLDESFTIISFANGRFFGGGMKVAPGADIRDGLMDVMIVRGLPKFIVPFLLPLFIGGWHASLRCVCRVRRCREVRLHCPGMTFNIDGELSQVDTACVRLLPSHLPVRLPGLSRPAQAKAS